MILPRILGLDGVWGAGPIADGISALLTAVALSRQLRAFRRIEGTPASPTTSPAEAPALNVEGSSA